MNRKYIYPLVIIIVTVALYYADDFLWEENISTSEISKTTNNTSEEFDDSFLPTSTTGAVVKHNYFTLSYSEENEEAEWVAYELKKSDLTKNEFERPYFIEDKSVKTNSADWRNYKNSGYDRGHLCPAGDRRMSFEAYNETFLTSNISPQDHDFNAGIWNRLEQKVRYWAEKYDGVYIVTGGVLKGNLKTIGYENVSVPTEFYKIVVDASDGNYKAIAFLIPNKSSSESFYKYAVSIDEIEARTGIDFFPQLPDSIENKLESMIDLKSWGRK
ncbi:MULTISPECIES: DNA/RNA non-specific endonuclease [Aequorivita]|uniref:Endonuclease n=1 Tax=Aequorivita iocasae TaxID=2803865 RepID=A0ABX7DSH9_9FLAO|nr:MULTISPECIES: DNA/RNA non-specific endonuclease [Aequorivita]QQX77038.1 DNA/RNA non-specific endonuclease [Aequorivita iocasae]UCA56517.1 DNA/RNA non-specific endonuclease [Aequorivita sp. F7]